MLRAAIIITLLSGIVSGLFIPEKCCAQTVIDYAIRETDLMYALRPDSALKETATFFPNYDEWKELHSGYEVPDHAVITLSKEGTQDGGSGPFLYARVFSRNIRKVTFRIGNSDEQLVLAVVRDGYQFPDGLDMGAQALAGLPLKVFVHVSYEPIDPQKSSSLVLGDMSISTSRIVKYLSPIKVFRHPPFDNPRSAAAYKLTPFDSYGNYVHYPEGEVEEASKAAMFISDSTGDTKTLLGRTLLALLNNYPFYREKNLVRKQVLKEVRSTLLRSHAMSLCTMVDTLNQYLAARFGDPHFFIRSACNIKGPGLSPIQVYQINGQLEVAAVLDDTLKNSIPLGSKLLKIDGVEVSERASATDVNRLLRKRSGEFVRVGLLLPAGTAAEISYRIADKYKIPANMMPSNLLFRKLNDSTAYYKINRIDARLPTDFASWLDTINTTTRLVLDLRGCGGGDLLAGAEFLSYMLRRSFRYFDLVEVNGTKRDSVIVQSNPAPFGYRADGKIILLVDKNTACAAELLINSLSSCRKGTTIWGKEKTMGALSIIQDISLPADNIGIGTNALGNWKILLNGKSIEGKGIEPDRTVNIETVYDLQPYNDKVLRLAISQ